MPNIRTYPVRYDTKTPLGRKALSFMDIHWRILADACGVSFDSNVTHIQLAHRAAELGLKAVTLSMRPVPQRRPNDPQ